MVVLDATFLLLLIDPNAGIPIDETTGLPVERCQERIDLLLANLSEARIRIAIPTPALAEVLVGCGASKQEVVSELINSYNFRIEFFDTAAAVEVALLTDGDLSSGRKLSPSETKAKLKYDRQIIAIAKSRSIKTIYTDDEDLARRARQNDIKAVKISELPLPPVPPQGELELKAPDTTAEVAVSEVSVKSKKDSSQTNSPPPNEPPAAELSESVHTTAEKAGSRSAVAVEEADAHSENRTVHPR